MSDAPRRIIDVHGVHGEIVSEREAATDRVTVRLADGSRVAIDRHRLVAGEEGGYHYDGAFPAEADAAGAETVEEHRIPLARERASVHRETRETGRVRIEKTVRERVETIDEPVRRETVSVERVPIDRVVEAAPPVRTEGNVLIVPVVEERLVVTKQLVLKEEVHVTRQLDEQHDPRTVTLRSEEIDVTREDNAADSRDDSG